MTIKGQMTLGTGQVIRNADTICNRQYRDRKKRKKEREVDVKEEKRNVQDQEEILPPSSLQCLDACHANLNSAGDRV